MLLRHCGGSPTRTLNLRLKASYHRNRGGGRIKAYCNAPPYFNTTSVHFDITREAYGVASPPRGFQPGISRLSTMSLILDKAAGSRSPSHFHTFNLEPPGPSLLTGSPLKPAATLEGGSAPAVTTPTVTSVILPRMRQMMASYYDNSELGRDCIPSAMDRRSQIPFPCCGTLLCRCGRQPSVPTESQQCAGCPASLGSHITTPIIEPPPPPPCYG